MTAAGSIMEGMGCTGGVKTAVMGSLNWLGLKNHFFVATQPFLRQASPGGTALRDAGLSLRRECPRLFSAGQCRASRVRSRLPRRASPRKCG